MDGALRLPRTVRLETLNGAEQTTAPMSASIHVTLRLAPLDAVVSSDCVSASIHVTLRLAPLDAVVSSDCVSAKQDGDRCFYRELL